jgi:hypothetical protein
LGRDDLVVRYDAWTYTTSPTGHTCTLTYRHTVPTALALAVISEEGLRMFTVKSSTAEAGEYVLGVEAVNPDGDVIGGTKLEIPLLIKAACDPPTSTTAPTLSSASFDLNNTSQTYTWDAWTS